MTDFSRRQLTSILIAAVLWSGITIAFVAIPVQTPVKDPDFREIRIQLASTQESPLPEIEPVPELLPEPVIEQSVETPPVTENIVTETPVPAPAPASETVKSPETAEPAPKAAEPAPAQKKTEMTPQTSAPEPVKADPAPAAKTPVPAPEPAKQTLVKSVDQLMAEQNASRGTKKTTADVDWDALFGDSSSASSSVSTGEKVFAAQEGASLSGTAAASSSDSGTAAAASSNKVTDTAFNADTAAFLSGIADAAGSASSVSGNGSRGSASGVSGGTGNASSGGESPFVWGDGIQGRKLIRPSTTEIIFTDEQKLLITASVRDIHISFTVRADGNVERNSIGIDKKASLPAAISQEIERQISNWLFETGGDDGQAVFVYSIIKE